MWRHVTRFLSIAVGSLLASIAALMLGDEVFAADAKWAPTIVSREVNGLNTKPVGQPVRAMLPQYPDFRFSPKQIYTRQSGSLPDGAWSSIVTGTVPEGGSQGEGNGAADAQGTTASGEQGKPKTEQQHGGDGKHEADPQAQAGASADGRPPREKPLQGLPPDATPAQQYCFNTADSAADARFAWQQQKIKDMEAALDKRALALQEVSEEAKSWLAKREEYSRKAQDKLVAFYAKMKPDAAAPQISAMDEDIAAALLMKLEPKVASLFLAEIEPAKAAKLAALISGLAKVAAAKKQKSANAASPPAGAKPAPPAAAQPPQPGSVPQQAGAPNS